MRQGNGTMGCPKLKTENWVFLRGGEKHPLFPRKPREKNRSRSAPAEMDDGGSLHGMVLNDPVDGWGLLGYGTFIVNPASKDEFLEAMDIKNPPDSDCIKAVRDEFKV